MLFNQQNYCLSKCASEFEITTLHCEYPFIKKKGILENLFF